MTQPVYAVQDWGSRETVHVGGAVIGRGIPGRAERIVGGFRRTDSWSVYAVVETTVNAVACYAGSRDAAQAAAAKLNAATLPLYAGTGREQAAIAATGAAAPEEE